MHGVGHVVMAAILFGFVVIDAGAGILAGKIAPKGGCGSTLKNAIFGAIFGVIGVIVVVLFAAWSNWNTDYGNIILLLTPVFSAGVTVFVFGDKS